MLKRNCVFLLCEVLLRLLFLLLFVYTETLEPFERVIQPEEWWLYKNPHVEKQHVTTFQLFAMVLFIPLITASVFSGIFRKSEHDFFPAVLCFSLALLLNGIVTNIVKLAVGRPRPDFFFRCFPDGEPPDGQPSSMNLQCVGNSDVITEGRKSFPSGHSSFAFASLGFCALYMSGKLQCFNHVGRGKSWRLCLCCIPPLVAIMIAISRTCDYRHHWQDVCVGSLIGAAITYLVYRQYYPSLSSEYPHLPHTHQVTQYSELKSVSSSGALTQAVSVKHM